MSSHPGKLAVLHLAACDATATDTRRRTLIRCVFGKDTDEAAILAELNHVRQLHQERRHTEVAVQLERIITERTPREVT